MEKLETLNLQFREDDTLMKIKSVLDQNKDKNIIVSNSGGADSTIMLDLLTKVDTEKRLKYKFFDTGIEFEATKNFLKEKMKQGWDIEIIRAFQPVPLVVKQRGQPFINKYVSEMLERLQKHNFNFQIDGLMEYPILLNKFPNCKGALKWWSNWYGSDYDSNLENQKHIKKSSQSSFNIGRNKYLKEFILEFGLPFKVSAKCCHYAKKMTSHIFEKENKIDMVLTGIRKAEGGIRARVYKTCITHKKDIELYMPLLWWSNEEMKQYKLKNNIEFSECYESYGLKRTGCAGCPLGRDREFERKVVKQYEPNLSRAIENIFKDTYIWTKKYFEFQEFKNNKNTNLISYFVEEKE